MCLGYRLICFNFMNANSVLFRYMPKLLKGGTMRDYQLDGLAWLIHIHMNGANGILADEMGLGKTIQTIAFLSFLRGHGVFGPFLIAAPLSTLSNWIDEFSHWAPDIPVLLYHGSKTERENLRIKYFGLKQGPRAVGSFPVILTSYEVCINDRKFLQPFYWNFIIVVSIAQQIKIIL